MNKSLKISLLRNLGPESEKMLADVGIHDRQELDQIGPIEAYKRVKAFGHPANLSLLWAMVGALMNINWQDVPQEIKDKLKSQL